MDENNTYVNNTSNNGAAPYRASTGNLNTGIGTDNININSPTAVNMQGDSSSNVENNDSVQYMDSFQMITPTKQANTYVPNYEEVGTASSNDTPKTYVTMDNRAKKKKSVSFNLGKEFGTALILVIILLIFVFFLPNIADLFRYR